MENQAFGLNESMTENYLLHFVMSKILWTGIKLSANYPIKLGVKLVIDNEVAYNISDCCVILGIDKRDETLPITAYAMTAPIEVIDWHDERFFVFKVQERFMMDYFAIVNSLYDKVSEGYLTIIKNTYNPSQEPLTKVGTFMIEHFMYARFFNYATYALALIEYLYDGSDFIPVFDKKTVHPAFNVENETIYLHSYNKFV